MPHNRSKNDPKCSGEGGNTSSLPSARDTDDTSDEPKSQAKHWHIVIHTNHFDPNGPNGPNGPNDPNEPMLQHDAIEKWLRDLRCEYVFQLEACPTTGRLHYDISFSFPGKTKKRLSWIKNHFHKTAHGSHQISYRCENYSSKPDTRIAGPWSYPKPLDAQSHLIDYFVQRGHTYKWWQRDIINLLKEMPNGRYIHWYWEPNGNVGKSIFMRHLILRHNVFPLANAKTADIAYAFKNLRPNQNAIVMNIPRTLEGHINTNALEAMLDGQIFSTKYESGFVMTNFVHLILFANFLPDTKTLSADRWIIKLID